MCVLPVYRTEQVTAVLMLDEQHREHYEGNTPALLQLANAAWFKNFCNTEKLDGGEFAVQGRRMFESQKALLDALGEGV